MFLKPSTNFCSKSLSLCSVLNSLNVLYMEWKRSTLVSWNCRNHFTSSFEVAPLAGSLGLKVNFTSANDEWSLRDIKMSLSIRIRSLVDSFVFRGTLSCCKTTCSRYNPLKVASNFFSCKWVFSGQRFPANIQTKERLN